jgi:purine nucleoside phosphorylase
MGLVAIIGGSGVHDSPAFKDAKWESSDTGFVTTEGNGVVFYQKEGDAIFIPRHGLDETGENAKILPVENEGRHAPSITQYAANFIAAHALGARVAVSTSCVGSLHGYGVNKFYGGGPIESVESLVVPDDFVDESGRDSNIFRKGIVIHENPRPAFSPGLREILLDQTRGQNHKYQFAAVHSSGTYVTIPGDGFGSTAEGRKRAPYADIVGMTNSPEVRIALRFGMHHAVLAFVVDMDREANHEDGTLAVMQRMSQPHCVPAYMTDVLPKLKAFADDVGPINDNLKGNIIPGNLDRIENKYLRAIAAELVETYCTK